MRDRIGSFRPLLLIGAVLLVLVGAVAAFGWSLGLVPPKTVTMASGRAGGGYYATAERYRRLLARDGIRLRVIETAGSVENARLLADGVADIALLQGGVAIPGDTPVEALAAVFLEPFIVFHRSDLPEASDPTTWDRYRVALGEPGSGTRAAVMAAGRALGLEVAPRETLSLGGPAAAEALLAGEADVAVFVTTLDAPFMAELLADTTVQIATIRDVEAVTRRLPFLRRVDIPPAAIDYVARVPERRIDLTAVLAALVVRDGLHPAIVDRLTRAAIRVHEGGSRLVGGGMRFPHAEGLSLPVNDQARALIQDGPGALDGVLPWWITAQLDRVLLFIVPVAVLALPLLRALPGLYAWRMRARVYRRYDELIAIDNEVSAGPSLARRRELVARLAEIDAETRALRLPASYRDGAYALRLHIDLVRRRLTGEAPPPELDAPAG